jgi:hypothetical protein
MVSFVMFAVLGLDVVTSESLFGYESTNKDILAAVAAADISGERIVLPDTSQFLQPSIQVNGSKLLSQYFGPLVQMIGNNAVLVIKLYVIHSLNN